MEHHLNGRRMPSLPGLFVAVVAAAGAQAADVRRDPNPDWASIVAEMEETASRVPLNDAMRRQMAVAYNNYGVSLSEQRQWVKAAEQLEHAVKLDRNNSQFKENLSNVYLNQAFEAYQQRRRAGYERYQHTEAKLLAEQALELSPDLAPAYLLLGDIEYDNQRLKEAQRAWAKAQQLSPGLPGLQERQSRLSQEMPVENDFDRVSHFYFDIRHEEEVESSLGWDVRDVLLEARRIVGSDFRYWPKHKLVVLVYSAPTFRQIRAQTPEWVGAQYDGKIRLPVPGQDMPAREVRQILFHEYTHAVIHDLTQGQCPLWLNEGLAEYEGTRQGVRRTDFLASALRSDQLIPWEHLDASFRTGSTAAAGLAYQQSHSMVEFLVDRYSLWRVRQILEAVAGGASFDQAVQSELRIKVDRLHRQWLEWLPSYCR